MRRLTTRNGEENRCGDRPRGTAGTGAPPAAFNLGLCRLRGILSPPVAHGYAAGALFFCAGDNPCSDSQIHPLKSVITAVLGLFLGKILQRFPSLPHEIRNHCSRGVVAFCRWNHSPSRQLRMESDADLVAATTTAGGTILLCSNKNLSRSRNIAAANDRSRRNHPPLQERKSESDAEERCRYGRCRRNHPPLQQRKIESDEEPRCCYGRSRRNHSPLPLRKLESVTEHRSRKRLQ